MLKIKEFAALCGVSVKTLQLYDRMGIFSPARIDPETSYRYYEVEQMLEFNTIISFKKVGFRLAEIAEMKKQKYSREQVMKSLLAKREEHLREIQVLEYDNENITAMIRGLSQMNMENPHEDVMVSKISCLENEKMEHDFSQIIWL